MARNTITATLVGVTLASTILGTGCGNLDPLDPSEVGTTASALTASIGGVDLDAQCKRQYGSSYTATLRGIQGTPGVVYTWSCQGPAGALGAININQACSTQYSWPPAYGRALDSSNAYSWQCFVPTVTLFRDDNYGGTSQGLSSSNPDLRPLGTSDIFSSLKLDGGLVNVYSEINYGGTCQTFVGAAPALGRQAIGNDTISSVKLLPSSVQLNVCHQDSDGCSAGDPVYRGVFYNACVGHDRCYSTPGRAKSDCDSEFGRAMSAICGPDIICLGATLAFYAAVAEDSRAQTAYDNDQRRVQSCDIIVDRGEQYWQRQACWNR